MSTLLSMVLASALFLTVGVWAFKNPEDFWAFNARWWWPRSRYDDLKSIRTYSKAVGALMIGLSSLMILALLGIASSSWLKK